MSKMALDWHKKCLENFERSMAEEERKASIIMANIERMRVDFKFRSAQLERAEKMGIDGYDADRFMKKDRVE